MWERRYRCIKSSSDRQAYGRCLMPQTSASQGEGGSVLEKILWRRTKCPKKLWRTVSSLLGKPESSTSSTSNLSSFMADEFLQFWENKVDTFRADTAGALPPDFICTNSSLSRFQPVREQVVNKLIYGVVSSLHFSGLKWEWLNGCVVWK